MKIKFYDWDQMQNFIVDVKAVAYNYSQCKKDYEGLSDYMTVHFISAKHIDVLTEEVNKVEESTR